MDMPDPNSPHSKLRQTVAAVYAFYDYDQEPIYVGQTSEGVGTRIGRHLTGQRSDAVAKFVLDPFEVADIEVWTLPDIADLTASPAEKRRLLNMYEGTVYQLLLTQSRFHAVLNEAVPVAPSSAATPVLPASIRGRSSLRSCGMIVPTSIFGSLGAPITLVASRN